MIRTLIKDQSVPFPSKHLRTRKDSPSPTCRVFFLPKWLKQVEIKISEIGSIDPAKPPSLNVPSCLTVQKKVIVIFRTTEAQEAHINRKRNVGFANLKQVIGSNSIQDPCTPKNSQFRGNFHFSFSKEDWGIRLL